MDTMHAGAAPAVPQAPTSTTPQAPTSTTPQAATSTTPQAPMEATPQAPLGPGTRTRTVVRHQHQDIHVKPFIVIWEVTRACQLVCKHCRADAQHRAHPGQLDTDRAKAMLDDIAAWDKPRPLVVFTGGDPFERADLEELVRHGVAAGLNVSLSPSVTPGFTRERLAGLREAGANAISLSLDGAEPATHDAFRGFSGTFDATIEAAAMVRELGYRLQVNSTVTRDNVSELPRLFLRAREMGVALWSVFFLVPTGRGEELRALSPEQIEDVMHWLHDISSMMAIKTTEAPHYRRVAIQRATGASAVPPTGELYEELAAATVAALGHPITATRRPRPPIDVNAGRGFVFVDHLGDVYPSGFLPLHCGSVKDRGLRAIYRDSEVLRALRTPSLFHGKCGSCEFREVCGGSRSHAYARTGDYLASDPTCVWEPAQASNSSVS